MFPWSYDTAFLACLISNIMRGKDQKPFTVTDFMPADQPVVDPLEKTWQNLRSLAQDARDGSRIDSNGKHNR